ncbi:MAG TPA: glycoside hydrolase family 57 protein [Gammaproteobacteria bacterium]
MSDSSRRPKLNVVLCWHMHQPQYCNMMSGEYHQPWTYLHAIKDYVDMAAHIEAVPNARAVVNFAPILLDQISDYAGQVRGFLREGKAIRDPLLDALCAAPLPTEPERRQMLIKACLRANQQRLIDRFPRYRQLAELARLCLGNSDTLEYLSDQFLVDLLVWYHLAWLGETVRRSDVRVRQLMDKGGHYTLHDRRTLMTLIGELLSGVIDRYARLAKQGKVEISVTPYAHPILPLLLDITSARDAMPMAPLPHLTAYPGGRERSEWHIREAINTCEQYFGFRPRGCWPAEGGVSAAALDLLGKHGFAWAASGESVLFHSAAHDERLSIRPREEILYQPYHVDGGELACFFRDDGLSDLLGFAYSDWHADDAVANLIHHLETIQTAGEPDGRRVVSIILDGENAWEYYPENAYYFLRALYQRLAEHPGINLTTFSDYLDAGNGAGDLQRMVAGSWVYGTFSTWIGDADKNRGWDMLGDAKRMFDEVTAGGRIDSDQLAAAQHQLSICEGSDWFWWFGDYNPADTVQDFDRLYRMHLANLYQLLGKEPPEYLTHAFSHGSSGPGPALGGVMRHGQPAN